MHLKIVHTSLQHTNCVNYNNTAT